MKSEDFSPDHYATAVDDADGGEDSSLLPSGHNSPSTKASLRRRRLTFASLIAGLVLASFSCGYLLGRGHHTQFWNLDSVDLVPSIISKALLSPGGIKTFEKYSTDPFVRSEDPELAEHSWRYMRGQQMESFFEDHGDHGKIFLITAEDMERMGKDPSKFAHIGTDWGYGDAIYPTRFDHSHQLHCIYMLLRATAPNSTVEFDAHNLRHYEHCLWGIYEYIACHVTLDVYNFKWVEESARPFPDHASQRQCRDMNALETFYNKHDVSTDARLRYLVPQDGDYIHPISDEHRELNRMRSKKKLWGEEWLRERRKRFDKAMEVWRRTGKIPIHKDD